MPGEGGPRGHDPRQKAPRHRRSILAALALARRACRCRDHGAPAATTASENLAELCNRTQDAAHTLQSQAAEIHELTEHLEELAKDTSAWYAATRARVEARATLEQAEELRRVEELDLTLDTNR
jgi:hypothetical protein